MDNTAIGATEPPKTTARLNDEIRHGSTAPVMVSAAVAWAMTVAPVGFDRHSGLLATVLGLLALAAGIVGPMFRTRSLRYSRHLGITAFVALCTLTWLSESQAIHPLRMDPIRGVVGAIAWGVFGLSWGDRWGTKAEPQPLDREAPVLVARSHLPPLATTLVALGVLSAIGFLALAWSIREVERGLVAQAVACVCGVFVVSSVATVATARGRRRSTSGKRVTPVVVRSLVFLVAVAVAGAVITALR